MKLNVCTISLSWYLIDLANFEKHSTFVLVIIVTRIIFLLVAVDQTIDFHVINPNIFGTLIHWYIIDNFFLLINFNYWFIRFLFALAASCVLVSLFSVHESQPQYQVSYHLLVFLLMLFFNWSPWIPSSFIMLYTFTLFNRRMIQIYIMQDRV